VLHIFSSQINSAKSRCTSVSCNSSEKTEWQIQTTKVRTCTMWPFCLSNNIVNVYDSWFKWWFEHAPIFGRQ
jgi:hypothetical protein